MNDERIALEERVNSMTTEQICDELESDSNILHSAKTAAFNASIRLPNAIETLREAGMIAANEHEYELVSLIAKTIESVELTLHEMRTSIDLLPIQEKQIIEFMRYYARTNDLDAMTIMSLRGTGTQPICYVECQRNDASGGFENSIQEAMDVLDTKESMRGMKEESKPANDAAWVMPEWIGHNT